MKIYYIIKIFHTIKYLRISQIYYRIYYLGLNRFRFLFNFFYQSTSTVSPKPLHLIKSINSDNSYLDEGYFLFLNIEKKFKKEIDWDYDENGLLWSYNLNYFDYLHQDDNENLLFLLEDYIDNYKSNKVFYDPYPTSLRGINWIKYLSFKEISNSKINNSLFFQYNILYRNIEYHLLGNHLLENAFSLLYASYYFNNERFYSRAEGLLIKELEEQILEDGAHFELSTMYHKIILFRILDSINLLKNNSMKFSNPQLLEILITKASIMLGWLESVSVDGYCPMFNDSAFDIAPSNSSLINYSNRLNIDIKVNKLNTSGFRTFADKKINLIIKVNNIVADYIPGHSHADTFTFELLYDKHPIIVDMGVSTYERNRRRLYERSTESHNTICFNNSNSSQVWSSFRVGNRANVSLEEDSDKCVRAIHDGYKKNNILHERVFSHNNNSIIINDTIINNYNNNSLISNLHFHPTCDVKLDNEGLYVNQNLFFKFNGYKDVRLIHYKYPIGFNKLVEAIKIKAMVDDKSSITINYEN